MHRAMLSICLSVRLTVFRLSVRLTMPNETRWMEAGKIAKRAVSETSGLKRGSRVWLEGKERNRVLCDAGNRPMMLLGALLVER